MREDYLESTQSLVQKHRELDEEIDSSYAGNGQLLPGIDGTQVQTMKNRRCAMKTSISIRASGGDRVALAYASERGWPTIQGRY